MKQVGFLRLPFSTEYSLHPASIKGSFKSFEVNTDPWRYSLSSLLGDTRGFLNPIFYFLQLAPSVADSVADSPLYSFRYISYKKKKAKHPPQWRPKLQPRPRDVSRSRTSASMSLSCTRPLPSALDKWGEEQSQLTEPRPPAVLRSRGYWVKTQGRANRARVRHAVRFVEKLDWAVRNGSLAWCIAMARERVRERDLRRWAVGRAAAQRGRGSRRWAKALMMMRCLFGACDGETRE